MRDPDLDDLLARLAATGPVHSRAMFGGHGLYREELFFGLVADGRLYLRAAPDEQAALEAAGCEPFQPFADKAPMRTYWSVHERELGARAELMRRVERAVAAAQAARDAKAPRALRGRTAPRRAPAAGAAARIPNLGPVSMRWLAAVGVRTLADLERRGSVATYRAVLATGVRPNLNLLSALEAALLGLRWDRLPDVVKANLRERAGAESAPRRRRGD